MELAGFSISPAERLRILKVLESTGQANLASPEKLKYLLCPVLVQGRAEQERFYEIFDRYWEELQQPWPMPELDSPTKRTVPTWGRAMVVALVLGGLTWAAIEFGINENPPAPKVFFKHDPTVSIGDTVHFQNLSENIDTASLRWEIVDTVTGQVELVDTQSLHLDFVPKKAGENHNREIRLFCSKTEAAKDAKPIVFVSTIHLLCNNPPQLDTVLGGGGIRLKQAANFEAKLKDADGVQFAWDFGDSATASGVKVSHKFDKTGEYIVTLTANRAGLDGDCSETRNVRVNVGQDKAYFAAKTLLPDQVEAMVNFSWGTWVLMGLLGLVIIWNWVRWAARKPPLPPEEGSEDLSAAAERYRATDKGPYFIPFRPQEGFVRMEPVFFRIADVLRQRQEGLRKNMDVPASVQKTIATGGFPNLLSRADAVPTEYLFLIDEQSPVSHQSKLYTFLVDFLRKREVLGEVFYFKTEPIRFWNAQFPEGITPEQLVRFFPFHRLLVMGDCHGLLDPNQTSSTGAPRLRTDAFSFFRHWKHRILLTPMPVVSWTFREGALHQLFAIFPSDTEGLGELVKFAERGMDGEELPTYSMWCESLLEGRQESDVNYRRWRTAAEHQDYLRRQPLLYRWVCALAVYPRPDWSITLAIGRALSPIGLELNYDNLLIISRIPWLQTGELSPKLRKELLNDLDAETERLAREAVHTELAAVETLVQGSHANQEQRINLAMQNFALAPQSPENQAAIRELLALNLVTPRHLNDLNQNVERHVQQQTSPSTSLNLAPQVPDIHAFLEENKPRPAPIEKPFFTKNFWRAAVATMLYLLIFIFAWHYGGTEELTAWTKPLFTQNEDCQEEFSLVYSLKKECTADSAVLYNNAGVKAFLETRPTPYDTIQKSDIEIALAIQAAEKSFKRALELRPDYALAKTNLGNMYFNNAKLLYDVMLDKIDFSTEGPKSPDEYWKIARTDFRKALPFENIALDALHAIGLTHFYATNQDSALYYFNEILQVSNNLYFDTLRYYPNLKSLLDLNDVKSMEKITLTVSDEQTGNALAGVLVVSDGFRGMTDAAGKVFIEQPKGVTQTFVFTKTNYQATKLRPKVSAQAYSVKMRKLISKKSIDIDNDGVPDAKDKCPKEPGDPKNAGCPIPITKDEPIKSPPPVSDTLKQQPPPVVSSFKEPEMVFVKGGTFSMGCDEKRDGDCQPDEQPVHDVTLSDFSIGKYEVTNEEYAVFLNEYGLTKVKDGPYKGEIMIEEHEWGIAFRSKGDITTAYYEPQKGYERYPAVNVTWYGAVAYTEWLSKKMGGNFRLPTEAQWEYAARGGSQSRMTRYSGSNNLGTVAWNNSNADGHTHAVGLKAKNELGIFDMNGNALEWCNDWYGPYPKSNADNPTGPRSGRSRILRGGSFYDSNAEMRIARRVYIPSQNVGDIGFRLARDEYRASGK